ncbi:MAG: fimbrillin family protein, partial [Muribaculaceae bacterium]|nr:fimbrillin family protein [Muribaculaceae bacterium]
NIMKKTQLPLIAAAVAALGLTSCAEEEIPSSVSNHEVSGISFRPAMAGQTRASEVNNSNLSDIYATTFMGDSLYFHDVKFSKDNDGYFNSLKQYLWPGDTTTLTFYSYAPSLDELGADITINGKDLVLDTYVTPESIADQVDFITAKATGNKDANEATGVPLTFSHRLAQVEVRAKSDNKQLVYEVAGVRIGRPQTTGTFDFNTNTWTLDSWHETAVWTSSCTPVKLGSTAVSIMGESGNGMFIPQKLIPWSPVNDPDNVAREAYLSVLVRITTDDGVQLYPFPSDKQLDESGQKRKYAWASIPISDTWEQGKKYIYTLDFTDGAGNVDPDDPTPGKPVLGDPIKFTVNVENWVDTPVATPMTPLRK